MKTEWSSLIRLKDLENHPELVPARPGVYIIMKGKRVSRVGGVDPNGILYIGQGVNLRQRLKKFLYADHIASYFLWKQLSVAQKIFRTKILTKKDAERIFSRLTAKFSPIPKYQLNIAERAVLFSYIRKYGELPPLNFSLPRRLGRDPGEKLSEWATNGVRY